MSTNGTDANGRPIIRKGTTVRIRTTNGGDTLAILDQNHRPTYDAIIVSGTGYAVIAHHRINSIEVVS